MCSKRLIGELSVGAQLMSLAWVGKGVVCCVVLCLILIWLSTNVVICKLWFVWLTAVCSCQMAASDELEGP